MPTSRDVAKAAGVSQTTVSRVLSGNALVNHKTRKRILDAMEAIGYRPNLAARAMKTSQIGTVGVVVARLSNPLYPELLLHIGAALQAADRKMIVWHSESGGETAAFNAASQGLIDGIIFAAATAASVDTIQAMSRMVPIVLVHRSIDALQIDQIAVDNLAGGRLVAEYFLRAGRQRPAIIAGDRTVNTVQAREDGYCAVLDEHKPPYIRLRVDFASYEQGYRQALNLVKETPRPDAVFCVNDVIAFGCIDGLRDQGIRIPDDIWVVGYDDVAMACWSSFKLTTVVQPLQTMGELAVDKLLARIEGRAQKPCEHIVLPSSLVVRDTTACYSL